MPHVFTLCLPASSTCRGRSSVVVLPGLQFQLAFNLSASGGWWDRTENCDCPAEFRTVGYTCWYHSMMAPGQSYCASLRNQ
ncbi:hypothetical protein GDO81_019152 [Engystomops pustulosus]|uniref:Uncharacterized protein n=1 Tax=Engystomops pustulosus TaxID=76066 RepID=A0AAV6YIK7_ENGPU|nr:hypothetical protein GDO81_019152 [Engystomops pustulosus]